MPVAIRTRRHRRPARHRNGARSIYKRIVRGNVVARAGARVEFLRQRLRAGVGVRGRAQEERVEGVGAAAWEGASRLDDGLCGAGDAAGGGGRAPVVQSPAFEAPVLDYGCVGVAAGCCSADGAGCCGGKRARGLWGGG